MAEKQNYISGHANSGNVQIFIIFIVIMDKWVKKKIINKNLKTCS
jgi:hypothetical protein